MLKDCARVDPSNCLSGEIYELAPCNTQPCIGFCPPDWVETGSEMFQNRACFKVRIAALNSLIESNGIVLHCLVFRFGIERGLED